MLFTTEDAKHLIALQRIRIELELASERIVSPVTKKKLKQALNEINNDISVLESLRSICPLHN